MITPDDETAAALPTLKLTPKQIAKLQRIGRREMNACDPDTGSELINAGLVELRERKHAYGHVWRVTKAGAAWLEAAEIPRRPNTVARKAYETLLATVQSLIVDDEPLGGCAVTLVYHRDDKRYHASRGPVECPPTGACAPTLDLALLALSYCDKGERVEVNKKGFAVCRECHGEKCDECDQLGLDPSPPYGWIKGSLFEAVLEKKP